MTLAALDAPVSPAHFAMNVSRGMWVPARHLLVVNRKIVEVATSPVSRFLMVEMPPRSGKSWLISKHTPPWYLGMFPDNRLILTSYETTFAESWGREGRNLMGEFGPSMFGVELAGTSAAVGRWNIKDRLGGMVSVGMGGALTGRGGNLIIIDDPVKGWAEAQSELLREHQWEWYGANLRTRLEPGGSIILLQTRWHEDDLAGRLLKQAAEDPMADQWEVVRLPAIAEPDVDEVVETPDTWTDLIGRHMGEALWPERFPIEVLRQIERTVGPIIFDALYQQRPTNKAGGLFQTHNWRYCDVPPVGLQWVRRWDLAATEKKSGGDPDWTAGVLMARTPQTGLTFIATSRRKQAEPDEVEKFIRGTAFEDRERWGNVRVRMSQDPGQAGKALCQYYRRQVLHGFDFAYDSETGDKVARAMPLASQQGGENVVLVRGEWNKEFIEECRQFPRGAHDDQVDAAALAYQECAGLLKRRAKLLV